MCKLYQKSMKDPDDPREQDPDDDGGVSESSYESPHGDGQPTFKRHKSQEREDESMFEEGGTGDNSTPHSNDMFDMEEATYDMRSKYDKVHAKWKRFAQDLVSLTLTLYDAYMSTCESYVL